MGKTALKLKWHWFINPLALLGISNLLGTCDWYFIGPGEVDFYFSTFYSFIYHSLLVGWFLIALYVKKEAIPPWYIITFWILFLLLGFAFRAILDYLNIGAFKTFRHI